MTKKEKRKGHKEKAEEGQIQSSHGRAYKEILGNVKPVECFSMVFADILSMRAAAAGCTRQRKPGSPAFNREHILRRRG